MDVYLLHNPSEAVIEGGEAIDALLELKHEGKIRPLGSQRRGTSRAGAPPCGGEPR